MRALATVFFLFIFNGLLLSPGSFSQDKKPSTLSSGKSYNGRSDLRLILLTQESAFDSQEDLLNPSDETLKRESMQEELLASTFKSMIPIAGQWLGSSPSSETDVFQSLLKTTELLSQGLKEAVAKFKNENKNLFPIIDEFLLAPFPKRNDLFYNQTKISVRANETANVIGLYPFDPKFDETISANIRTLQQHYYANWPYPVYLLAFGSRFEVNPNSTSRLSLRILIGLKPATIPMDPPTVNDKVKLDTIEVPDFAGQGIVGAIEISIEIPESGEVRPPEFHIQFGAFDRMEGRNFLIKADDGHRLSPRLLGSANKKGAKWVQLNFSFPEMKMDLAEQKITGLKTLVSPGFKIGKGRFTFGGIHANSVDEEFKKEINQQIQGQLEQLRKQGEGKINEAKDLSGWMNVDTLQKVFETIMKQQEKKQ